MEINNYPHESSHEVQIQTHYSNKILKLKRNDMSFHHPKGSLIYSLAFPIKCRSQLTQAFDYAISCFFSNKAHKREKKEKRKNIESLTPVSASESIVTTFSFPQMWTMDQNTDSNSSTRSMHSVEEKKKRSLMLYTKSALRNSKCTHFSEPDLKKKKNR